MSEAPSISIPNIERWNDSFAREHDIDDYYARSSFLIRWIERCRLRCIARMTQAEPDDDVLEVGCGGGHVLRLFHQSNLTGVDVSGEMLAKARRNLKGCRAVLLKGELHALGLEDGGFDKIICSEVLEHTVDPESILIQIRRLLRPGGRAVITFPNDPLVNRLKSVIRRSGLTVLPPLRRISWGGDHYHLHVWTITQMRCLLSRNFRVVAQHLVPTRLLPIRCCFQCAVV